MTLITCHGVSKLAHWELRHRRGARRGFQCTARCRKRVINTPPSGEAFLHIKPLRGVRIKPGA